MDAHSDTEADWQAKLATLLARHPRSSWREASTPTAAFWLDVHEHLRRSVAGLEAVAHDSRSGRSSPAQLAVIAAPRLHGLVASMHGHHQIEDFHYFPVLREEQPSLAPGFDRLEAEHVTLLRLVAEAEAALAALNSAAAGTRSEVSAIAAERAARAIERLCADLLAHLTREEDLVVPLLIEHGER